MKGQIRGGGRGLPPARQPGAGGTGASPPAPVGSREPVGASAKRSVVVLGMHSGGLSNLDGTRVLKLILSSTIATAPACRSIAALPAGARTAMGGHGKNRFLALLGASEVVRASARMETVRVLCGLRGWGEQRGRARRGGGPGGGCVHPPLPPGQPPPRLPRRPPCSGLGREEQCVCAEGAPAGPARGGDGGRSLPRPPAT